MDEVVSQWKQDFPMNDISLQKIRAWEEENNRGSKKTKDLRNGAWAAYLRKECIAKQLAMSFLKFPFAMVHTLLQGWVEYMKSPEHAAEKARAQKLDTGDAKAVTEKQHQQELNMKVHRLRHQMRQIKASSAKTTYSDMTWHQKQQHERWKSENAARA